MASPASPSDSSSTEIIPRGEDGTVVIHGIRSTAAEKLLARSWAGLQINETVEGADNETVEGAQVEVGRSGVARGYTIDDEIGRT